MAGKARPDGGSGQYETDESCSMIGLSKRIEPPVETVETLFDSRSDRDVRVTSSSHSGYDVEFDPFESNRCRIPRRIVEQIHFVDAWRGRS